MPEGARRQDRQSDRQALAAALSAPRIAIERVTPQVEEGRYPAKATVGQPLQIEADIFMDGHEQLATRLLWRAGADGEWQALALRFLGNDRWRASITPTTTGLHWFTIEAWLDRWASYRHDLSKKQAAGVSTPLDIADGVTLLGAARTCADAEARALIDESLRQLDGASPAAAFGLLMQEPLRQALARCDPRPFHRQLEPALPFEVERRAAGYASWYELFPRSQARQPGRHGRFDDVIARLPAIRAMGFDVLYLPPIHPIGKAHRKGRNNSLNAAPGDPGSPYAIGGAEGGHDAVHPELGGIEAFRRLRAAAADQGIELALDFAIQCSPDHPWLREHPGWFARRADGSIRYAENPPKKYEDIVNVAFYAEADAAGLWQALRDVVAYWIDEGVKIFRVDNPHTKPLPFWEWLIADLRTRHPETIFLAEAFTRPAMMVRLGKIGFSQSYTYFTWRNSKRELTEYLLELNRDPARGCYRPHFFVNTPDINPYFLQTSGRPGFLIRAALASTLSGLWGMYSGFELCEGAALPGKEEYLDSEKYELRSRDWNAPGNIVREISALNRLRRENPALQTHLGLRFYNAFNEQVLYYGKATEDLANFILVAVSLDPHQVQETYFEVPLWEFGLPDDGALEVEELMRGECFVWRGKVQHWRFVPSELPFAVWRVRRAG